MTVDEAREKLALCGQTHVLEWWDSIGEESRQSLLSQVKALDAAALGRMAAMLRGEGPAAAPAGIAPADVVELGGQDRAVAIARGEELIRAGEVGVLLVAGGQGSRLGFDGPKGIYEVGPVSDASLFEIHARKVLSLERAFGCHVPLYIMTSDINDAATREFFSKKAFFGLSPDRVRFFVQGMWPALDGDGRVILDEPGHIFMSPDGHGGILRALAENGMFRDMERRGITTLFYFQVDNPMVEVADPAFIGLHAIRGADVSVKVCAKRDPSEGLGVVVKKDGRNAIVEYTELSSAQKEARGADGRLRFLYGSVAIHVFSLDFLVGESKRDLPLHVAHKKVPFVGADGKAVKPDAPNGFKFEKFIFDVLPDAGTVVNLAFERGDEFSPVKNANGADSPATTRRDMALKFARWLEWCGVKVPRDGDGLPAMKIEIDPCFASNREQLRKRLPPGFSISGDVLLRN